MSAIKLQKFTISSTFAYSYSVMSTIGNMEIVNTIVVENLSYYLLILLILISNKLNKYARVSIIQR